MGGEAAKERRRLKRLAQQQQNEKGTVVESASTAAEEVKKGGNNALLRLQRKLARKASGKFKPLQGQSQQPASLSHKRKPESSKNRNPAAKSSPAKKFKGGSDHNHSPKKRNNVKTAPVTKKMKQTKTKPKKPKHLKRKIEQLSEAMSGGSDVAQLDEQMKKLISQMEEFKKIKGKKSKEEGVAKDQSKDPDVDLDQSSEGSLSAAEQLLPNEEKEAEYEKPASSASDEDSSSDEEDIVEDLNPRSRGKRRRGRRESSGNENSQNEAEDDKATKNMSEVESNKISADKSSVLPVLPNVTDDDETKISKKTPKKDDKRRCIGRKPVTDFVVGEFYTGKVQYIKPRLGAFIDIGCHSDAFIHISCISDSYISSVDEILNVGDEVKNARVVSIDREKKRVTLSLRREDAAAESQKTEPSKQEEVKKNLSTEYIPRPAAVSSVSPALSTQTGADLKRERKLARRAARRALQQGE
jgi:predicted RNA-binding protein with RPS1 domain